MSLSHCIEDYPEGIVLPIDKPLRWTSADVIRKVKYAAIHHFRKRNLKVGHAGTLDPLATGILLVCIGPATKKAQELQDHDKEYLAEIRFGATTPSYDLEKEVDRHFPYANVNAETLRAILPQFLGEQEQIAPLFSAKSVDGVRAYEMARKMYRAALRGEGADFDAAAVAALPKARIRIDALDLLAYAADGRFAAPLSDGDAPVAGTASSRIQYHDTSALLLPTARIRIACSKGTYIRALARDLGEALGTGAHLSGLVRSRSGAYSLNEALSLDAALALLAP